MAKVVINGKEHTCSEIVKQEMEWQDTRLTASTMLAKKIEEKLEQLEESFYSKRSEIQDLIDELKELKGSSSIGKSEIKKGDGFIYVSVQEPPHNIELIARSPMGILYLTSWRVSYGIFACQSKTEKSHNWAWKLI